MTNLLSDNEPLKWKLRDKSLCLLSVIVLKDIEELNRLSFEIISIMEIARYAGIISKMNHSIIVAELRILIEYLEKETKAFPAINNVLSEEKLPVQKLLKGSLSKDKDEYVKTDTSSRQSTIINLLKNSDNLNVKDFAKSIQNCSEKTIQRELSTLVIKGILRKKGERRWSTYSLN
ncbi:MAG: hypothetical protein NUV47_02295 [Patescibacteria group bacterium]|nr:hypothetical protein [Patescibacteria group bacterium]